jgi:hypothetical protein
MLMARCISPMASLRSLPFFAGQGTRDFGFAFAHNLGRFGDDGAPFGGRHAAPAFEGDSRSVDGGSCFCFSGQNRLAQYFIGVGGVGIGEAAGALRLDEFTAYEITIDLHDYFLFMPN